MNSTKNGDNYAYISTLNSVLEQENKDNDVIFYENLNMPISTKGTKKGSKITIEVLANFYFHLFVD